MSMYGSQRGLQSSRRAGSRTDLTAGGTYPYARSELVQGGGNGYGPPDPYMDGYNSYTYSKSSVGGMGGGAGGAPLSPIHQKAFILQGQCQDYLKKAAHALQAGGGAGDSERYMSMAKETIEQLKGCAQDLRQMGQPSDNVVRSVEECRDQLKGVHMAITGSLRRTRASRGSSGGYDDTTERLFNEAISWIGQHKRLIETGSWADDPAAIEQQLVSHQKLHSSIQRSAEVDRARDELLKKGDKANQHYLEQEWDNLQQMSFSRTQQLRELQGIIEEISKEIMWVNDREEEELVFDWGDKNIDQYVPKKEESYSKLMSALEEKEKDLNKLKTKVDGLLKNNHPAADKIEAYMDTLQTQWSWLLQITKCISVHLKENATYSQFFMEANETYSVLQKEHETIRKKFTCDKNTSLDDLLDLFKGLEKEKERIVENKRQVQHLVSKSKSIVRLKPRSPEEKSSSTVIVQALCDFKQDQKVICKDNEGILKDNSQRSKWLVTGPGGLDMLVPSVCLLVPPPNPLSISLANKNEQYYDAILSIWTQYHINMKSLITWQYFLQELQSIRSLNISMVKRMRPEEYRSIIKRLETFYEEFKLSFHESQMFAEEDRRFIENQFTGAQAHYEQLVVQLPTYTVQQKQIEAQQASEQSALQAEQQSHQLLIIQQQQVEQQRHQQLLIIQQQQAEQQRHQQLLIVQQQQAEQQRQQQLLIVQQQQAEQQRQQQLLIVQQQQAEQQRQQQLIVQQQQAEQQRQQQLMVQQQQAEQQRQQQLLIVQQQQAEQQRQKQLIIQQQQAEQQRQQQLLIVQQQQEEQQRQQQLLIIQAAAEAEARRREEERKRLEAKKEVVSKEHVIKKETVKVVRTEPVRKRVISISSSASSSHSLSELHTLRLRLEEAEGGLTQHIHICLGEDGEHDCSLRIQQLETVQRDIDSLREEYLRLKERILKDLEGMTDADKAQFLRSEIGVINQKLGSLEGSSSAYLQRLRALRAMLESVARAEDIVKVHEARLTERETTSLVPGEVEDYMYTLKSMKAEMEQKKDVLSSMEAELGKASHWNAQVGGSFHRCDMILSKYSEQVNLLGDRWRRIQNQIDSRLRDLELYLPQLQHYKRTSTSLSDWIGATRKRQDTLQATKIEDVQTLHEHMNNQKALNSEIKGKRETVESVLRDTETCVNFVKDYETDLSSYTSGLETLLNIPIKRTMLKSPCMDLTHEATVLQTRYIELFTLSGDYHKYLGEMLKNMEELKIRNTRIELLEEELRLLKEDIQDRNAKNRSLEDAIAHYQLELAQSQDQLLSVEEVKRDTVLQCSATKDSLDSTHSQLADLNDQLTRLNYLIEEEKRKRRLAEERYGEQQEEYDVVLRRRQKELQEVNWAKMEVEKSMADKDREAERLRRQLAEEAARIKEMELEMSKVRSQCSAEINNIKLSYESQVQFSRTDVQRLAAQREEVTTELQQQCDRIEAERRNLEDELRRLRLSLSQTEELRRRAEEETQSQRSVITEEGRRRRELEAQVESLLRKRGEDSSLYREELAEVTKNLEEKTGQLEYITHSLEEETCRRRTIEEEQAVLEQTLAQVQAKLAASSMTLARLSESEEELGKLCLELERERSERCRVEQNTSRLQGRIKDLQSVRDGLENQVETMRKTNQDEVTRRTRVETQLEETTMTMREHTSTITTLRHSQEQANVSGRRGEEEQRRLQEELEKSLRENKASTEHLTQLSCELKALQQHLLQEQARVKETNLRNETLYKTIEEKSRTLNENTVELQRLKELTETLTKERLRLEEELRGVRHEREELMKAKRGSDDELTSQIAALELQLQSSSRNSLDYQSLVSELSSEREKLKLETEEIQKQAIETTTLIQSNQSKYSDMVGERDALLLKLKMSDQDKDRFQKLEEELHRIKLSLESELHHKQRLQEENEKVKKDFIYWKDQYESKEDLVRQYDSDKERLEWERNSLKSEIERLMRELKEVEETYKCRLSVLQRELTEGTTVRRTIESELKTFREPPTMDPSTLVFDGVRKPVTAQKLLDCGVLDEHTFNQLKKGQRTVPEVSVDKKVSLKGTGPIAGVIVNNKITNKKSLTEAKKEDLLPPDIADLLLDAQAATGHIIDPINNQKLTVEEACDQGVVDEDDRQRLLAAEAAAVGYRDPRTGKPLSAFQAMKKGLIDKNTTLRLLQAQECVGGILDPVLSVFLPKDTAMERDLIDEVMYRALNQRPECYLDPDTELGASYVSLKRRCKTEPHTSLLFLPVTEKKDPSKLVFDGVRKPVTAKQLLDCGVLDKPTLNQLVRGEKTVLEVSADKKVSLKGTGPIAGVIAGPRGKKSLTEAKKENLLPPDSADLLLDAQAATGHIIDPINNQKLTVAEAFARGVVDKGDRDRLLAAEAAAIGYKDPSSAKPLSVFEAMKKGLIDRNTALQHLQAQNAVGGILDPILSVFLPKDTAIKRNLLDEDLSRALNQNPQCYLDPDTEKGTSYGSLKKRCKMEPHTGLLILPITERLDPSTLVFDGVRKPVTAQQLLDCGVLDKPTFNQLVKGEKTVPEVSDDKKVSLKGTGPIAGVIAGHQGKKSLTEAKRENMLPPDSADLLLDAQAATGHIIDPINNQKLTVEEACDRGVVDNGDRDRLLAAEAAAIGYNDPRSAKPLSVFEAMRKGLIDKNTALKHLQAQDAVGGILDPILSVFLPKDTAIKRNLLDEAFSRALNQNPQCYLDPDTEKGTSYESLKKRCKMEPHTGLLILPITERLDPSTLVFDGVRKPVTAQQLLDCGVMDKATFNQLVKGDKTVQEVSDDKKVSLKGTGPIAGVIAGHQVKKSLTEAKRENMLPPDSADLLLDAQAATGHIIDPINNQKLTVEEACDRGVVDKGDRDRLLAAEAAAIGYKDPRSAKPLSVFEAMKKGLIDKNTALKHLQAQDAVGGILDPILSVFLPKETAIKRNLLDEDLSRALNQNPQCYLDPDTEKGTNYGSLKKRCKMEPHTGLLILPIIERLDPSKLVFDGVRKPVTAKQLLDCGVLDKPTFNQLVKGEKTIPEVSADKKVSLKGTGPVAAVIAGPKGKKSLTEAKKENILPPDSADLLLDAQAATGHIIDPITNQKLTVDEACARGVVDKGDRDRLLAAEAAAMGYKDPSSTKPLSVFEAMNKGLIDKNTALRHLQAQEALGGILDPILSVFLPKDTAIKRNLLDEDLCRALNQNPQCYLDPDTEKGVSYGALKKRCKTESHTGLLILPITERLDPSKLVFDGVRKPVTAQQLLDCGVLDKPTFNQLVKGEKTVSEVSVDKKVNLKGTGPVAAVIAGPRGKKSLTEAKKENILPPDSADLLLDAQAATGHIIDPITNRKLTVDEACARGVVDKGDRDRLLAAEAAAMGYKDPSSTKPLSVFEAMKKGWIDKNTALRHLQAQEAMGGILDPILSVFLPKDTAIKRNLLDEDLYSALNQNPQCYLDPDTEKGVSYGSLKKRCKTESLTGLLILPITERLDPSKLVFDGVRKPVTAQQLLDCGVLDKPTFNQLVKGEKTVSEVSVDKKVNLKGTGPVAAVIAGPRGKKSLTEAKKENILPPDSADLLLDAQAATGHIIDPITNRKLTVDEACARGVVDKGDRDRLLAAEAAAMGYKDPSSTKPLSVFEAMKKGLIDKNTALRHLQAQEAMGGILDPILSVFLPKDTAIKHNLLDEDLDRTLNQNPQCYLDPDTEKGVSYGALKKRCKTESHTGLHILPITERLDPSKLVFDGVRKPVTAQQLLDCGVLDKPTFIQLVKGEKTVSDVSVDKKVNLKGTGSIAGVASGPLGKMSLTEAKKQNTMSSDSAVLLLEAQAATGHIIDPRTNQKLTLEEAFAKKVVDKGDRDRLLAAEAAAIGYKDPRSTKPLSVFEAMKKGLIDKNTALRHLQAQEAVGGILDPILSVFLSKDTAIKRNLLDEDLYHALNQNPQCYLDPDTEKGITYGSLKKRCKTESHTGLLILPITERLDPTKLIFDGVRKPVTAQQLLDCGVLDKPTFNQLVKGEKTVPEVSVDKKVNLKGTGPVAAVLAGPRGKKSLTEAKKENILPPDSADLLLDAQAATGHIIDPINNQKLTVDEACARGVVDKGDRDRLLAAEAAAMGYKDPSSTKPLSVFEAMKKGLIDKKTALRHLQAQEAMGGILDPILSVFLPKDTAIKHNLLDEDLHRTLNQNPQCYLDPDTEKGISYGSLKKRCKTESHTGLHILPITERLDPSKLVFDGVRKPVTAQQLLDCGILDKPTFIQLVKGEKTVSDVSVDKKVNLKGTGSIAGVAAGPLGKISLTEAKKQNTMSSDSAVLLLEAQAATGHIIDPRTNEKLTLEEAFAKKVVDKGDRDRLLAAEAAAIGYKDPRSTKPLSVFEAMKKGLIDKNTALRHLQAQEAVGGILDPILSVFLSKDTAIKRNLLDEDLYHALNQNPQCYLDPDTEKGITYGSLKKRCKTESHTGLLILPTTERLDPTKLIFDGVRKPVTAQQLFDCGVLDKPTFNQLVKGEKTVPEVSVDKKVNLKGTGPVAAVIAGPRGKKSLTEAKKENILPPDSADLLLDAQAATGHIIDPINNQKLTVDEACARGVVDKGDRDRLLAAEAAAMGYKDPSSTKPLSVFEAMKKGLIDKKTALRHLQAQEAMGGILDPILSVFLPKDTAIKHNLLDEDLHRTLNQNPQCYLDPDTEKGISYGSLKKRCKTESHTGLHILPITERLDPSKLVFDGVRKPVTAQQLLDCGVLDKPTFIQLVKGEKTVSDVSVDKKVNLKGTGSIAGVAAGPLGKMSLTEAKKQNTMSSDSADLLLEAQAATGHIIDPRTNQKLTLEEAFATGVVDKGDRDRLLAAEAAAIGYKDPRSAKPLSVFEAMRKGLIDKNTALRHLQAQEAVGGILDPILSVFLPKDTAIKCNLLDEDLYHALNQNPQCYLDPDTEKSVSYGSLKKRCKTESLTGLLILPITERLDPSKLVFDGVCKPVTAQQLLDCGVLDKPTFNQLVKGEKTVSEVSVDKKVNLKGTGPVAAVIAGPRGKKSLTEAKRENILPPDSADLLLDAQAATGHIIDPINNQKLTVEEACARGVVDKGDRDRLLAAEAAAIGYKDPRSAKPLSVFEAMKKGLIDKNTALRHLQAQEAVGGILDPILSVFLPKDTAIKHNLLDEDLHRTLNQNPQCYLDPDTEKGISYGSLKKRCKTESHTGLHILPITERLDPSKLVFDGVRKPVTAQQLLDCGVLDKPTFIQLVKGEKTVSDVSVDKKVNLKGTGSIAGVAAGPLGKMSLTEAKKQNTMSSDSAVLLLEAQAATGHIIDPRTNEKLTLEEAFAKKVVDKGDRDRLLAAEAAAIGYKDPRSTKPLSVFEAMKKGLIDKNTALRHLQAQEAVGGILDPILSVFLSKDTAIKRNLLDEDLYHALNQNPQCYLDPDTEKGITYGSLKKRCKTESHTGLLILPTTERLDPTKLIFDGVRKPVTAQQLLDCGVLDKPTFNQLVKGEKTVPEVSVDKKVNLKGTGPVAAVLAGPRGKKSLTEAKKENILPPDSADLLLDAQAATGHIIDPINNQKLTVDEACARGVVDKGDRDRLLAAEAAAMGYKDPSSTKPLSVFEAMKKGLIDKKTALRHLQAQEAMGGILDPILSVFLPKDTAIKHNLLDEDLHRTLNQNPQCYLDPDTEKGISYGSLKKRCKTESHTGLHILPITERLDPSKLVFDGVRKPVTAQQLLDCGVLDKPTFIQLVKGEKTVSDVSVDKKVNLKGTGSIAGVAAGPLGKMSLTEAKKQNTMSSDSADLLLEAQAATGHIIDPRTNQKLTLEEAFATGVVDKGDRDRLLAAEAAAIGYKDPRSAKPLSVFEAMRKGLIDKNTALRHLQAQEAVGGILDPILSVFLPKDTAIKCNLLDEDLYHALNQNPQCYLDPDTEKSVSYGSLKKRCKTESLTGLLILPITERLDPSKLVFDGVCKPVTAQQLLDCGVLDKPTFNQLVKGEKTVSEVSVDKKVNLKGTGPVAAVIAGPRGKKSLTEAKRENILPPDSADLLLDAQAATGHIIDPINNQKLTVEEACARGVVDKGDRDRLLAAEAAAIGYKDPRSAKPLSVFEAMKKGLIDKNTALRHLQAQEAVGGILDPILSVYLPKDTAIKHNLLDEDLNRTLNQNPQCFLDPNTEKGISYGSLKKRCKTESHTGLLILPITERSDPSKLVFDGVRKPVTAQQLLDCGVLDKPTFNQLVKGEKTVSEVSVDKKVNLKGTGPVAAVIAGTQGKKSLTEAKRENLLPPDSADLLLDAQAATGHIIDPITNRKLTVDEACARGVVDKGDRNRLLTAEAAAMGYKDPSSTKPLSVLEAMKKGLIDKKTALRHLQAQEAVGGILDPILSVFLPKDTAIKRNLLDEDLSRALYQNPQCYLDPDTEKGISYGSLKKKCKTESHTGLHILPITERLDPSKLVFDGVCKPVTAQQLLDCGVLDKPTFNQLVKGEKTVLEVSVDKKIHLKGTGSIGGVIAGTQGKKSLTEAKKENLLPPDSADLLLDAQAATGNITDPRTNQKLTVAEACAKGVVDKGDRDRLLAAEAASIGYKDPSSPKLLSVFEAMKKGLIDKNTALRHLQAQEAVGGILDPILSVFLSKDTAIKRNLLDEDLCHALNQSPECYLDPDSQRGVSYVSLKKRCKVEPSTGLLLIPVAAKSNLHSSTLVFDGICKPVTAQQLLDCGVLDKLTLEQLVKGQKTVPGVSVDKKVNLKGTGSIAGVAAGPLGKMSLTEAKKQNIMSSNCADLLLEAQAATGHIIDPRTNQKLTVEEACARGVVDEEDRQRLLAAEAAAVGFRDHTAKILSAGQAMRKGLIDSEKALRLLQAQESVGGILDPVLSVFLPRNIALDRDLIDENLYHALIQNPECYLDPDTQLGASYVSLKNKCKADPSTGLLLLPAPEKPLTVQGLRDHVSVADLVDANLLERSDVEQLRAGKLTSEDIEVRLRSYLRGSTCIAGVYDEASDKIMPIYLAMKEGLLRPGTTLELLEAQAAGGFIVDPVNNLYLTVSEAYKKGLVGPEFKDKLLSAERAVTGYTLPGTNKIISLFQAIDKGLIEKGHGIRLLEAQIACGGIIDPQHSHRIEVDVAYKKGYFNKEMNDILTYEGDDTKGFFDPNTQENLTYLELKKHCITDKKTGLVLLPIIDKKKKQKSQQSTQKNTLRKRRVVIVDPDTKKEMTVREAYDKGLIDYETFLELSEQECEWEEITITAPDGSTRLVIIDKKTGKQYDIRALLEQGVIDQSMYDQYCSHRITLTQFADIITKKAKTRSSSSSPSPSLSSTTTTTTRMSAATGPSSLSSEPSSLSSLSSISSTTLSSSFSQLTTTKTTTVTERSTIISSGDPLSPDSLKHKSSVSITLSTPAETVGEQNPVGAIFDTDTLEKISITEALNRGLVDSITAQRLLEAQACTGGIVNPANGRRLGIQEASRQGILDEDMATRLKPAQKAYVGFEDVKTKKRMSAALAMKEKWLPYEAGQRFMEFQFVTGGLHDPEMGCRRTIEDALKLHWLDGRAAQKLQDTKHHPKILTCPKSKLKISYKEAMDNCLVEENTGVRMLQASSTSSRGISSPYNVCSAPGSSSGSRSGSRLGSRRSSVDLGSPISSLTSSHHRTTSYTSFSNRSTN